MLQTYIFYFIALLVAFCSVMVISSRNPIKSAVYLVCNLFLLAALFAMLEAHFVAAIQILVYAGAIVVLFVFVIMLLNLQPDKLRGLRLSVFDAGVLLIMLFGFAIIGIQMYRGSPVGGLLENNNALVNAPNTETISLRLLTDFIWPFELASILILLAIVGAVVIAKKDKPQQPKGDL